MKRLRAQELWFIVNGVLVFLAAFALALTWRSHLGASVLLALVIGSQLFYAGVYTQPHDHR